MKLELNRTRRPHAILALFLAAAVAPEWRLNYHCPRLRPGPGRARSSAMGRTFIRAPSESRMPSPWPPAWLSAQGLSHALWHGRSVRAQLLIVFIVIDVIAGLVAGAVTILQARASSRRSNG